MKKLKEYGLRFAIWVASIVMYGLTVYQVDRHWSTAMRNGEPGITSDMILEKRIQISEAFREKILIGFIVLGIVALAGYALYWYFFKISSFEQAPLGLQELARSYRRCCIACFVSFAMWYVDHTFIALSGRFEKIQLLFSLIFYVFGVVSAVKLIYKWKTKKKTADHTAGTKDENNKKIYEEGERRGYRRYTILYMLSVSAAVLKVLREILLFFIGDFPPWSYKLIQYLLGWAFVEEPYKLVTGYDYVVAWFVPVLLLIILIFNLFFNAPPPIGPKLGQASSKENPALPKSSGESRARSVQCRTRNRRVRRSRTQARNVHSR